jgi:hypothetical protein
MPRAGWSLLPLTNRSSLTKSRRAQTLCGLLIAVATAALTSCHGANYYAYKFPENTFANRPIPPSLLAERVMVAVSTNGSSGSLQILDALRDIRSNIQNTKTSFSISGTVGAFPNLILSFPSEIRGYVFSSTGGTVNVINYGTEASTGTAPGSPFPGATSLAVPPTFGHIYAAIPQSGQLVISDSTSTAGTYALNIPNVYQVAVNTGDTVVLAMVRNSNDVYRVIKLNNNQYPTSIAAIAATGAVDCSPLNVPIYCAIPVTTGTATNAFDRPVGAYFSIDGTTAYILNCGPECGGTTSSVTFLQEGALNVNTFTIGIPNVSAFSANVPVPGGVTDALSDGTTLYISGQQLQADGLFAGNLSTINLAAVATNPAAAVTGQYSISDGTHTKMLFADDNTLWIGSQFCATGERAHQASLGMTSQAANYNCLTRFDRGALSASIVPAVVSQGSAQVPVSFPNTNQNQFYYGDLTGLCWVQNFHKVYTAYGGQVHAFNTADGSEINNTLIIVQGTALDVAYMDAITDADN